MNDRAGPGPRGLIVAAPASGQGKTTITLGLLRAFADAGVRVAAAKIGPDYIDPGFHRAALGRAAELSASGNIDLWAMRPATVTAQFAASGEAADLVICEGMMGLFDGAGPAGEGSAGHLAAETGWPVILVVDASAQAASVAALVRGFASHWPDVRVGGVIFNKVGGDGHGRLLEAAVAESLPEIQVLGWLVRDAALAVPERHLGLVLADEHPALDGFIETAGRTVADAIDLQAVRDLATPVRSVAASASAPLSTTVSVPVLGQRIAVARDAAFAFAYPHVLDGWRAAGAELSFFSPLGGETPDPAADAIYLPGGYPELHAGPLAAAPFLTALRRAPGDGTAVFGECGGFMVMGAGLVDGDGVRHEMAGLLPVETSFETPRLHFGYRQVALVADGLLGSAGTAWRAHEFHHASILGPESNSGAALFAVQDAAGADLGMAGYAASPRIAGSFIHLIDRA